MPPTSTNFVFGFAAPAEAQAKRMIMKGKKIQVPRFIGVTHPKLAENSPQRRAQNANKQASEVIYE
jgi:hypothetical protein